MTQDGIDCSRWDSRMVRSVVVQEPHRLFILRTHRILAGRARPSRYWPDSSPARLNSAWSLRRGPVRACFASRLVTSSTISAISRCSSALPIRAGISTMIFSPSR